MAVYPAGRSNKWRCANTWRSPIILYCPVPIKDIATLGTVLNATEVGIGDIVEMIQTDGDEYDAKDITVCADESKVGGFIVDDTEHNRRLLAEANSVESYNGLTRNTAKFADGDEVDIVPLISGMIINAKLKASETPKVMESIVAAGSGAVKCHPNDLAVALDSGGSQSVEVTTTISGYRDGIQIGKSLADVTSVAAVQQFPLLIK